MCPYLALAVYVENLISDLIFPYGIIIIFASSINSTLFISNSSQKANNYYVADNSTKSISAFLTPNY